MAINLEGVLKLSKVNPFSGKWENILETISRAFNLTEVEKKGLYKTKIAQLIAAIPFIAGCEDAERAAVTHLGTYLLTIRTKKIFDHKPSDDADILRRLKMIDNYIGGDRLLIERGLNLIALNMICDYSRDMETDKKIGKYNPITAGNLMFDKQKKELVSKIKAVECKYMDEILNLDETPDLYWGPEPGSE